MKANTSVVQRNGRFPSAGLCCLMLMISFSTTPATMAQAVRKVTPHALARFDPARGTVLDFGTVRIGERKQQTFSFANTGEDTLFIQSLELSSDAEFSIQFAQLTLAPKQTGTVVVQYAPRFRHSSTATLSFAVANGVAAPRLTLHGTGLAPAPAGAASNPGSLASTGGRRNNDSH